MSVLIFDRPWHQPFFGMVTHRLFPDEPVIRVSEFDEREGGSGVYLLRGIWKNVRGNPRPARDELDLHDVVARDRWLTRLEPGRARRIASFVAVRWQEILDGSGLVRAVISNPVDNFTTDLLHRAVRERGIPYLSPLSFYLGDRFRIAARGEANVLQPAIDEETRQRYSALLENDAFVPFYVGLNAQRTTPAAILAGRLRASWRGLGWLGTLGQDRHLNYFVRSVPYVARPRWEYVLRSVNREFDADWQQRLHPSKLKVLVALQLTPEATVDYWCPLEFTRIEEVLIRLVESLRGHVQLVVKEHPTMKARRPAWYYRRLRALDPDLIMPPPDELSMRVIDRCDVVVTWTSSVGIEAVLRGRGLVTFGRPYYWVPGLTSLLQVDEIDALPSLLFDACAPSPKVQRAVLEQVLRCSYPGHYYEGSADNLRPENVAAMASAMGHVLGRSTAQVAAGPAAP